MLRKALDQYLKDRAELLSAAMAFFTLLSIAPFTIVAVAVAGFVLGEGAARDQVVLLLEGYMGSSAAATIIGWVDEASRGGAVASAVGVGLLLITASRLIAQLRSALNQIWGVEEPAARGFRATVEAQLRKRLFASFCVVASGLVLLLVFVSRALLTGLHHVLFESSPFEGIAVQLMHIAFSIGLVTLLSAIVFKAVPDVRMSWKSAWAGALLTSILFNVGNVAVGFYLGRAAPAAAYGAAGSVVVILVWLYFSAQVFLFGAEFTQVYATEQAAG